MPDPDFDKRGFVTVFGGRIRWNKRSAIGVAGLATVLGTASLLVAGRESATPEASSRDVPAQVTSATSATSGAPRTVGPVLPRSSAETSEPAPAAPTTTAGKSLDQRVADARSANERLGTVIRPPKAPNGRSLVADVEVKEKGDIKRGGKTLRTVSARQDLTGLRELAWVVDAGEPAGKARCTNKIRLSNNAVPRARPTLLLCWRTSAAKSVYTVAVNVYGRPVKAESIREIEKTWARMR